MTSFIFSPNDLPADDMNVRSSLEAPYPEPELPSQDTNLTKSSFLRRKNKSLASSLIRSNIDQGITYGAKFSDKKDQEPEVYSKISRSVKIDCSGPASIINSPDTLTNEYFPSKIERSKEGAP